jgi:hypothetical protein
MKLSCGQLLALFKEMEKIQDKEKEDFVCFDTTENKICIYRRSKVIYKCK